MSYGSTSPPHHQCPELCEDSGAPAGHGAASVGEYYPSVQGLWEKVNLISSEVSIFLWRLADF